MNELRAQAGLRSMSVYVRESDLLMIFSRNGKEVTDFKKERKEG